MTLNNRLENCVRPEFLPSRRGSKLITQILHKLYAHTKEWNPFWSKKHYCGLAIFSDINPLSLCIWFFKISISQNSFLSLIFELGLLSIRDLIFAGFTGSLKWTKIKFKNQFREKRILKNQEQIYGRIVVVMVEDLFLHVFNLNIFFKQAWIYKSLFFCNYIS